MRSDSFKSAYGANAFLGLSLADWQKICRFNNATQGAIARDLSDRQIKVLLTLCLIVEQKARRLFRFAID
jgi:hypothetical protein